MRGKPQAQPDFLTVVNLNQCVPLNHPLRSIKRRVDEVLKKLSPLFEQLYARQGRPSIPSEQLLKARCSSPFTRCAASDSFASNSPTTCSGFGSWIASFPRVVSTTAPSPKTMNVCSQQTWPN